MFFNKSGCLFSVSEYTVEKLGVVGVALRKDF